MVGLKKNGKSWENVIGQKVWAKDGELVVLSKACLFWFSQNLSFGDKNALFLKG